ncbi:catecholate siderophore receptor Fiu [Pseudoduganella buxea]|uniref:Catecholate siderophore receptor Fiu n=1 Tax=Pseudoduganella buxea TaxID=1949069 RepID=A0A6I3T1R6_9BURK|nr:catecholate siderophore receptor Fiu [Pseudoduganella buxea]MTV55560.1 catecholate siderophore receptor Fiu [Pseudoduganella buxea]GGB95538.1 catecholate siderophore receptor Fiu [Pseudoduganella buxea]
MAHIKSRKLAPTRLQMSTVLAALLLPVAAQATEGNPAADDAARPLPEVVVGSNKVSFKADYATSPKYTEKLVDTPQTLTVIKKELIEQQGAETLTEALRNTPGVGAFFLGENGNTNTGDAIFMRGFDSSSSIYTDGVRDVGSISRDVFNTEQIDVLKGPAGTDSGRGSPTGSINLGSKQARLQDAHSASIKAGSGKQKRATADISRVIDADSGTAFRLNVMVQDSGNAARDVVENKRWGVAPTIAFGLNGKTRLHLSYLHIKQNNIPDGGVPTIGLPGYISPDSRSTDPTRRREFLNSAPMVNPAGFYGEHSDYDNVTADMATVRVEHDFSPTLRLQNTARYGKTEQEYLLTAFMGSSANLVTPNPADPNTWLLKRTNRTVKDQRNQILTNQTVLTGEFTTGELKHTMVGGLEFINEKQANVSYAGLGALNDISLYHPVSTGYATAANPVRSGAGSDGSTTTQALYLFDTVKIGEQWMVHAGVRADHFNTDTFNTALSTSTSHPQLPVGTLVPTTLKLSDTLVNGKLSLLYKPTKDSSIYATVASSQQPPGSATFGLSASANSAANPNYDPQETTTKEIGTKWDFLQQKLSFTAAIYETTVRNEIEQDPTDLNYYQTGKKNVKGIEIGMTGELAKNWLVTAGYTHMKTEVESGRVVTASGINNLSYTPKDAFTSWTSYTLPFGLKVGGGVRYQGKLLRGTDGAVGTPASAESYWVADAMASYEINKNIDLRLNVYNLADKEYVAAINKSGYRYTPGQPRSASVTATFKF